MDKKNTKIAGHYQDLFQFNNYEIKVRLVSKVVCFSPAIKNCLGAVVKQVIPR